MRHVAGVALVFLAACGSPGSRELSKRAASPEAGAVPTFAIEPSHFISDPRCGPDPVPPPPSAAFPGPCAIVHGAPDAGDFEFFEYDDAGREVASHDTHGHTGSKTYDDAGRLTSWQACADTMCGCSGEAWKFDDAGRIVEHDQQACSDSSSSTVFEYDGGAEPVAALSSHDPGSCFRETFAHDAAGNVTHHEKLQADGGASWIEDWTYDAAEHPLSHVWGGAAGYPSSARSEFWTYDDGGLVVTDQTFNAGTLVGSATYRNERGKRVELLTDAGVVASWTYCENGQLFDDHVQPDYDDRFEYGPLGLWVTEEEQYGPQDFITRRTYDSAGNLLEEVTSDGPYRSATTYDYSCWSR